MKPEVLAVSVVGGGVSFALIVDKLEQWMRIGGSAVVIAVGIVSIYYTVKNKGRK